MTDEIWRDVVGFEGSYQVSDMGRVRSVARIIQVSSPQQERRVPARILRPTVRACDQRMKFTLARRGKKWSRTLAQLMDEAGFQYVPPANIGQAPANSSKQPEDALTLDHPIGKLSGWSP